MRFRHWLFALTIFLSCSALAHSVVYEDETGHALFKLKIPEGWAVNLDGDRVSVFPPTSGAFIGTWFMPDFQDRESSAVYVKTLCEAYFTAHELSEPKSVQLDNDLHATLFKGKAMRDDSWGELRAMIFHPCNRSVCFAIQFTPPGVVNAPQLHESMIERAYP